MYVMNYLLYIPDMNNLLYIPDMNNLIHFFLI